MKIKNGAKRSKLDKRDYSFQRSFGTFGAPLPLMEYNLDCGKTMPDQEADGLPYGCTGYTQAEVAGDEDAAIYKPSYTYAKTCYVENHGQDAGCDIRNSVKVGQVYGVQGLAENSDDEAETHRRGAFYNVDKAQDSDWFDSMRLAMRLSKKPISVGTQWYQEWENCGATGILTPSFVPNQYTPWHNYKICGEKTIQGVPYLIAKSWQGANFGDRGWCYVSRETFNKAFDVYGTIAIIQSPFTPQDVFTIKLTMLQFILYYLGRMIGLVAYA